MTTVRDYTKRPAVMKAIEDASDTIIACWDDWEAAAGEEAQRHQDNDAWFDFMNSQLQCVLEGMLDQIPEMEEKPCPPK